MRIYTNGNPRQVELKPFDVVFLAGNPAHSAPPPFEHVALVGHSYTIPEMGNWTSLGVYGLPESTEDSEGEGLSLGTVLRWQEHFVPPGPGESAPLGHPESGWNLVMRPEMDAFEADYRVLHAPMVMGRLRFKWAPHYEVKIDNEDGKLRTNCLGFVNYLLTHPIKSSGRTRPALVKNPPLSETFAEYTIQYASPRVRKTPSIGHLAHSLNRTDRSTPYGSDLSSEEAEAQALAKAFFAGKA